MSLPTLTSERLWLATFQRLSTFDFRLSDYDQRLSRLEVSDFGWRLSDYDRPPNFRVEVRRFSDLLAAGGWRGWRLAGLAAGGAGGWRGWRGWRFAVGGWLLPCLQ